MRPNAASVAAARASTEPRSVTSVATASAPLPQFRRGALGGLRVEIGDDDARALGGEHGRDAAPDAAGGARDDCDLIGERLHRVDDSLVAEMQRFLARDAKFSYSPGHAPIGTVRARRDVRGRVRRGLLQLVRLGLRLHARALRRGREAEVGRDRPDRRRRRAGGRCRRGDDPLRRGDDARRRRLRRLHGRGAATSGGTTRAPAPSTPREGGSLRFDERTTLPTRPLIGCLAVAPAEGELHAKLQGRYGGNLDCREIRAGATVVLPAAHDGGGLYFGDCKALMGDGEIVGPPEVGALVTASAEVRPRPASMTWPRIETATASRRSSPAGRSSGARARPTASCSSGSSRTTRSRAPRPRCCWRWSPRPASARSATPTTPRTASLRATCSSPTAA